MDLHRLDRFVSMIEPKDGVMYGDFDFAYVVVKGWKYNIPLGFLTSEYLLVLEQRAPQQVEAFLVAGVFVAAKPNGISSVVGVELL